MLWVWRTDKTRVKYKRVITLTQMASFEFELGNWIPSYDPVSGLTWCAGFHPSVMTWNSIGRAVPKFKSTSTGAAPLQRVEDPRRKSDISDGRECHSHRRRLSTHPSQTCHKFYRFTLVGSCLLMSSPGRVVWSASLGQRILLSFLPVRYVEDCLR